MTIQLILVYVIVAIAVAQRGTNKAAQRALHPARDARAAVTPPPLPKERRKPKTKTPSPTTSAPKSLPINKEKQKGGI